jgi:hypothetical protein
MFGCGNALLPIPENLAQKLTRSQCFFGIATGINPQALTICTDEEFMLFMDLRAQHQWKSFVMTSRRWVTATQIYNDQLIKQNMAMGVATIAKKPRALMDKLGDIEAKVIERILTGNYKCAPPLSLRIPHSNFTHNSQEWQRDILATGMQCRHTHQARGFGVRQQFWAEGAHACR